MNHPSIKFILLLIIILGFSNPIFAQGCSDAGFCTMGAMRPDQHFSKKLNIRLRAIEIGQYYGATKYGNNIFSTSVDLNIGLSSKWTFQVKLPYTFTRGELKSTQGLGDFSLSLTYQVIAKEQLQLNLTVGSKIPTGDANLKNNEGLSLPMYYQTSLGTYDLVLGASLITKNWLLAVGYQQPFNSINNEFTWALWDADPQVEKAYDYPQSNQLIRGADVMLRIEKNFRFSRFNAHLGLLNIYRWEKDKYISAITNKYVELPSSDGLVVNLLGGVGYRLNTRNAIKAIGGVALAQRKRSGDGLSREFVITLGYQYLF